MINAIILIGPGVPYEVIVVAYTSVGRGGENERKVFFSEELAPTKPPEGVDFEQLSSISLNITWKPLTLFEARGFPEYRVVLTAKNNNKRRKRQSNPNPVLTENSFAVFNDLRENTDYIVMVGVRTGNTSGYLEGESIEGIHGCYVHNLNVPTYTACLHSYSIVYKIGL